MVIHLLHPWPNGVKQRDDLSTYCRELTLRGSYVWPALSSAPLRPSTGGPRDKGTSQLHPEPANFISLTSRVHSEHERYKAMARSRTDGRLLSKEMN